MPVHDFICTKKEHIPDALQFYPEKQLLGSEMRHIAVKDLWVRKYGDLFADLKCFSNSLDRETDRLAYHGITIMPPESGRKLLRRIRQKEWMARMRFAKLQKLLRISSDQDYYIVHFGI